MLKDTLASYKWPQFTQLELPRMGLMGPIGPLRLFFPQLTMLDLSQNQLTGAIPADLQNLSGLRYLNLANNSLYGEEPRSARTDCVLAVRFERKLYTLCTHPVSQQQTEKPPRRHCTLQVPCRPT